MREAGPPKAHNRLLARAAAIPPVLLLLGGFSAAGLWFIPAICAGISICEAGRLLIATAVRVPPQLGGPGTWRSVQRRFYAKLGGPFHPGFPLSTGRMFLALSGGFVSAIVLAILSGLAAVRTADPLITALFVAAVFMIVAPLIPTGGRRNFGALLWLAIRRPAQFRSLLALSVLDGQDAAGVRPRDQDPNLLALALAAGPFTPECAAASMVAFYRDVDLRDFDGALHHIEQALAAPDFDSVQRCHIWYEAAWASAALRHNAPQARVWLERARKVGKLRYEESVRAEMARSEGNYREAVRYFAATRTQFLKEKLGTGIAHLAIEWYTAGEDECRAALST